MEKQITKLIVSELLEGEITVSVATEEACVTFVLLPEEARKLSSKLFSLYVMASGPFKSDSDLGG